MLKENGETLGLKPYLFILDCGELFEKGKAGCTAWIPDKSSKQMKLKEV